MSGFDPESCRSKQARYLLSHTSYNRLGRTYFLSPQIANPQILGLFKQYKIRRFIRFASPHIRKFIVINAKIKNSNFLMYASRLTVNPQLAVGNTANKRTTEA
jgi:hypothetical protein